MHRRVGSFARALSVLALCWSLPSVAQDAAAPGGAAKNGPEAVFPADIPMRADADERFAQDLAGVEQDVARDLVALERSGDHVLG